MAFHRQVNGLGIFRLLPAFAYALKVVDGGLRALQVAFPKVLHGFVPEQMRAVRIAFQNAGDLLQNKGGRKGIGDIEHCRHALAGVVFKGENGLGTKGLDERADVFSLLKI